MTVRRNLWAALSLLSMALGVAHAYAYKRTTTQSSNPPCPGNEAKPLAWRATTLPYVIDGAGTPDVTGEAAFEAIQASFAAWQEVACPGAPANGSGRSFLRFQYQGKQPDVPVGFNQSGNNVNVVKWFASGWTQSARAIAVTLTTYDCNSGEIFDADITLNGQNFSFSATGQAGRADLQNTVTHEVGHFIGFDHDLERASTMYADAPLGETSKRSLEPTDIEGACVVYAPDKAPCAATVIGRCASGSGGCSAAQALAPPGKSAAAGLIAGLAGLLLLAAAVTRRRARGRRG